MVGWMDLGRNRAACVDARCGHDLFGDLETSSLRTRRCSSSRRQSASGRRQPAALSKVWMTRTSIAVPGAVGEVLIAKPTHLHRKNDQARMEMNWEC